MTITVNTRAETTGLAVDTIRQSAAKHWEFVDVLNVVACLAVILIYLYMITPLLSLAADDKRLMRYLIVVNFAIAWGVPLVERLGVAEQYFTSSLHWPLYMSQDMLYFLLGYYLSTMSSGVSLCGRGF